MADEHEQPLDVPDADDIDALFARFSGIVPARGLPDAPAQRMAWLRDALAREIDRMMRDEFGRLPQALYRVDVDERAVDRVFSECPRDRVAGALADLVLERLARTLQTRRRWQGTL